MYKIVIADDEPIERAVAKKYITRYLDDQLTIFLAENGREAVEIYKEEKCDIALLDISMPGVNGLDAARQIRELDPRGIIVFLTAFDEFDYAKQAIAVQALEYLLKPVEDTELVTVIEEAIRILDMRVERNKNAYVVSEEDETGFDGKKSHIKKQISEYIENNYQRDISLTDAAEFMKYSDPYFCKVFKTCFNKSFVMYLTEFRVEKSKKLLCDETINIKDISIEVGYRDSNYYTKVFKRMEGMTPSEYRAMKTNG